MKKTHGYREHRPPVGVRRTNHIVVCLCGKQLFGLTPREVDQKMQQHMRNDK